MLLVRRVTVRNIAFFLSVLASISLLFHAIGSAVLFSKLESPSSSLLMKAIAPMSKISTDSDIDIACQEYFSRLYSWGDDWYVHRVESAVSSLSKASILNSIRHLRFFGQCYLGNQPRMLPPTAKDLEQRLFPMFTAENPVFKRWDGASPAVPDVAAGTAEKSTRSLDRSGEKLPQKLVQKLVQNLDGPELPVSWYQQKSRFHGAGIVVSCSDGQTDEIVRLVKLLRFLKNELPIELVHRGDLGADSQKTIVEAARNKVRIDDDVTLEGNEQDIWFVDAGPVISEEWRQVFQRFGNKWVAALFNSFDDMILLDTDTVPFVNLAKLLESDAYKKTGALFFKDRAVTEKLGLFDMYLYQSLFPSKVDEYYFGIPSTPTLVFDNSFFKLGRRHLMESGLVMMKRSTHLLGLLISVHLHTWKRSKEPVHGDKELFWLGQSIAGNHDYTFMGKEAAAIGSVTEVSKNVYSICCTQVAHLDDDGKLLWLNGGVRNCKKDTWGLDYMHQDYLRSHYSSEAALKESYTLPLKVDSALIITHRKESLVNRLTKKFGWHRKPHLGCWGYMWCATGKTSGKGNLDQLIRFSKEEIAEFDKVALIWSS